MAHHGHGAPHLDLMLGAGLACPTLRLWRSRGAWRAGWLAEHRRRYLDYRGPIAGRGAVMPLWRGQAVWWRRPTGWCIRLGRHTTVQVAGAIVMIRGTFPPEREDGEHG